MTREELEHIKELARRKKHIESDPTLYNRQAVMNLPAAIRLPLSTVRAGEYTMADGSVHKLPEFNYTIGTPVNRYGSTGADIDLAEDPNQIVFYSPELGKYMVNDDKFKVFDDNSGKWIPYGFSNSDLDLARDQQEQYEGAVQAATRRIEDNPLLYKVATNPIVKKVVTSPEFNDAMDIVTTGVFGTPYMTYSKQVGANKASEDLSKQMGIATVAATSPWWGPTALHYLNMANTTEALGLGRLPGNFINGALSGAWTVEGVEDIAHDPTDPAGYARTALGLSGIGSEVAEVLNTTKGGEKILRAVNAFLNSDNGKKLTSMVNTAVHSMDGSPVVKAIANNPNTVKTSAITGAALGSYARAKADDNMQDDYNLQTQSNTTEEGSSIGDWFGNNWDWLLGLGLHGSMLGYNRLTAHPLENVKIGTNDLNNLSVGQLLGSANRTAIRLNDPNVLKNLNKNYSWDTLTESKYNEILQMLYGSQYDTLVKRKILPAFEDVMINGKMSDEGIAVLTHSPGKFKSNKRAKEDILDTYKKDIVSKYDQNYYESYPNDVYKQNADGTWALDDNGNYIKLHSKGDFILDDKGRKKIVYKKGDVKKVLHREGDIIMDTNGNPKILYKKGEPIDDKFSGYYLGDEQINTNNLKKIITDYNKNRLNPFRLVLPLTTQIVPWIPTIVNRTFVNPVWKSDDPGQSNNPDVQFNNDTIVVDKRDVQDSIEAAPTSSQSNEVDSALLNELKQAMDTINNKP